MPARVDIKAGPRMLVGKAFQQGFYWPTMVETPRTSYAVARGASFTLDKPIFWRKALQTIPITWPFAVWHLDMVGPL
jgi:hypothetical protein